MPMPITIPIPDWSAIFETAISFEEWMARGETATNIEAIRIIYAEQEFPEETTRWLAALEDTVHVLVIAEDWCPDVIRHVPVLQKMTEHTPKLDIRYISRTDHPDIFARYLTVGGEAIPKFVYFNDQFVECGVWGPMPHECREMIARGRACDDLGKARELVFAAYYDDPGRLTVINEVIHDIQTAACKHF